MPLGYTTCEAPRHALALLQCAVPYSVADTVRPPRWPLRTNEGGSDCAAGVGAVDSLEGGDLRRGGGDRQSPEPHT